MPVLSPPLLFRTAVSVLALGLSCGVSPVWAAGETIVFDGTNPAMLKADPIWNVANSLFPIASLADNAISVTGGDIGGAVYGGITSGHNAAVTNNRVAISGGSVDRSVYGGYSGATGIVTGNHVDITGGSVGASAYGGYSASDDATGNALTITGGSVGGNAFGGQSGFGGVSDNVLTMTGGSVEGNVYGGYSGGGAAGNKVDITDGSVGGIVYGGYSANGAATGNHVTISGNSSVAGNIFGGYSNSQTGAATGNSVAIATTGKGYQTIFGGHNVGSGNISGDLFTGNTLSLNAGNSIVVVRNMASLTFTSGGDAGVGMLDTKAKGSVIAPKVVINTNGHDVAFGGRVMSSGGVEKTGSGVLTLAGINTYAGGTDVTEGTLMLRSDLASGLSLANGATLGVAGGTRSITGDLFARDGFLDFYVPGDMVDGAVMLNVTGAADITNSIVNVGIEGGSSPLQKGDTLTLIKATALDGDPLNTTANGRGMQGVSLLYEFDVLTDAINNELLATVTGMGINPQTKALSEGRVAGMAFANQGADLAAGLGLDSAMAATGSGEFAAFAAIGGGSSRYDTGSHVDVDGVSVMTGFGWRASNLLVGAFVEAGWGNYDSHNSFTNAASVKGDGDTDYYGGGLLGRYDFDSGLYGEGSVRAGRASTDFSSADLVDGTGQRANYDSSATYYGAHAGVGYVWPVNDRTNLDLSSKYLWTHQNSDSVTVAGDTISFSAANSHRWRNGARFNYEAATESASVFAPYVGAAYEYEFDGEAKASVAGYAIDAPSLKGGTGIGELGVRFKPAKDSGLSVDLGLQGYVGVREGVAGTLQAKYNF